MKRKRPISQNSGQRPDKNIRVQQTTNGSQFRSPLEEFRYEGLDDPANQIRLLHLERGKAEEYTLAYSLTIWNKKSAPEYSAISYTWGPVGDEETIYVNGQMRSVRRNCKEALWQASLHFPDQPVWIDYVCIDQGNNYEKSAQVQMMYSIYYRAVRVLACAGPHDDESKWLVAAHLEESYRSTNHMKRAPSFFEPNYLELHHKYSEYVEWCCWKDSTQGKRFISAILKFSQRPYWSRLWTLQEMAAAQNHGARRLYLLCGEDCVSWCRVDLCSSIRTGLETEEEWYKKGVVLGPETRKFKPGAIRAALDAFAKYGCADVRDRLYAICSLVVWTKRVPRPLPDNSKSVFHVSIQAFEYLDLHDWETILKTFGICATTPEVVQAVRQRRYQGPVPASDNVSTDSSKTLSPLDKALRVEFLTETSNGRLSAPLVSEDKLPFRKELGIVRLRNHNPKLYQGAQKVFANKHVAALLCGDARSGDILACLKTETSSRKDLFLVLRHISPVQLAIVGQGFSVNGFEMDDSPWRDGKSNLRLRTNLTYLDALVLFAQDYVHEEEYDVGARFRRLTTAVSEQSNRTFDLYGSSRQLARRDVKKRLA